MERERTYWPVFLLLLFASWIPVVLSGDPRIAGARYASKGQLPYQVFLIVHKNGGHDTALCAATILSEQFVLTSASCAMMAEKPSDVIVGGGDITLTVGEPTVLKNVSRIVIHPEYDEITGANNVALIKVPGKFDISQYNLHHITWHRQSLPAGKECTISTWGTTTWQGESERNYLLYADVSVVDKEECSHKLQVTIEEDRMCAAFTKWSKNLCQGHAGSPLVCGSHLAAIVTSQEVRCNNPHQPAVLTEIFHFTDWILNEIV